MPEKVEQNPFHRARTPSVRVIGIGQEAGGDDAVGFHVIAALKDRLSGSGIELHVARDPMALLDLVEGIDSVIIVDALVGLPPGSIHVLDLEAISREPAAGFSSHGIGVGQAIALAREALGKPPREVRFVVVGIELPRRYSTALSPAIRAAVAKAAEAVMKLTSGN
jgi:hydrogenase maturation protease